MENKIILEVKRINSLMGDKKILLEQPTFLRAFIDDLITASPGLSKKFDDLLKTVKIPGKSLEDTDIDRFVNEAKKAGVLTDDEAKMLSKVLKNDADLRKALDGTGSFFDELKKVSDTKKTPDGFKFVSNIAKLSEIEVAEIVKKTTSSLIKNTKEGIGFIYNHVDTMFDTWLSGLKVNNHMINNVDEVYDAMYDRVNTLLKKRVADGTITEVDAKAFFDEITENIKCCSKTKNKLDDMLENGYVANKPKKTTTPNYGDEIQGSSDAKTLQAFEDDGVTPLVKQKTSFEGTFDEINFDNLDVTELGKLQKFYINWIEPYSRWWRGQIDLAVDDFAKLSFDEKLVEFEKSFKRGLDQFRGNPQNMNKAYVRDIIEKFQKLPRNSELVVNKNKDIYTFLWQDFKKNGIKYYENNPDGLIQFRGFCSKIEGFSSLGDKTIAFDELVKLDSGYQSVINKDFNDVALKKIEDLKSLGKFETYKKAITDFLIERLINIMSYITSGAFKTPGDYSRALIKELEKTQKAALKGEKVFTSVYQKKAAFTYFLKRLSTSVILIPFCATFIEMAIEGFVATTTDINLIDREVGDNAFETWFYGYLIEDIVNGVKLDNILRPANIIKGTHNIFTSDKNDYKIDFGDSWGETLGVFPGLIDNSVIDALVFAYTYMPAGGTGTTDPDKIAEEEVKKIKEKTDPQYIHQVVTTSESGLKLKKERSTQIDNDIYYTSQELSLPSWFKDTYVNSRGKKRTIEEGFYGLLDFADIPSGEYTFNDNTKYDFSDNTKVENRAMFEKWWKENNTNVGVKDGVYYYRICPRRHFDSGTFNKMVEEGTIVVSNKGTDNETTYGSVLIYNPKDKKYYDFVELGNILPKQKILSLLNAQEQELKESILNNYSNIINDYLLVNNIKQNNMKNLKHKLIESKRFDEDDYKHWKDTFTFQAVDEKNPGQYKDVKLNMDDVMDRIPHYRKKYDEDDSFVRAVVDTHENVVRFMFTKDLANIREGYSPVGFAKILQQLREARGENEIWSVARPASGNWFLVKGDFTPKELMGMDLEKNEPADREPKKLENSLETLKKKELTSAEGLKNDEKSGFNELPKVVKEKLREKFNNGWTTEEPAKNLKSFYSDSEVKSVFGDSIKIYKLNTNSDFFDSISNYSDSLPIKRGFCRSIHLAKQNYNLSDENKNTIRGILKICNNKFNDFLGLSNMS